MAGADNKKIDKTGSEKRQSGIPLKPLKEGISNVLSIPSDVVLDMPRIVISGNRFCGIENHKGIIKYSAEEIAVNSVLGLIIINGQGLEIATIFPEEIEITGVISAVRLAEE